MKPRSPLLGALLCVWILQACAPLLHVLQIEWGGAHHHSARSAPGSHDRCSRTEAEVAESSRDSEHSETLGSDGESEVASPHDCELCETLLHWVAECPPAANAVQSRVVAPAKLATVVLVPRAPFALRASARAPPSLV